MKSHSLSPAARASLAATLLGAASLFALPASAQDSSASDQDSSATAQEETCPQPTVVDKAPPPLPDYDQPPMPAPGYIWSPGNWSWDSDQADYYWVPGTWVQPPRPGLLWTPGYWGWVSGAYVFHRGYWGPRVGFYGGVRYGFGYTGEGYAGGRWQRGVFFYNRTVNNFGRVSIRNVYEEKIVVKNTTNISFNGGKGGVEAQETAEERAYARETHFAPTPLQRQHIEAARKDPDLFEKTNHGAPAVAATPRPAALKGPDVAPARGAEAAPGGKPGAEEKKPAGGEAPATGAETQPEGKPAAEEKKLEKKGGKPGAQENAPAGAETPAAGSETPSGNKPAEQKKLEKKGGKPGAEEQTPAAGGAAAQPESKPAMEEKKPKKPGGVQLDEAQPPGQEKRTTPGAAGQPAMERKRQMMEDGSATEQKSRSIAPMNPQAQPQPHMQTERPAMRAQPPAARPLGKQEDRRQP